MQQLLASFSALPAYCYWTDAASKCVDVSAFHQTGCNSFSYWCILIHVFLPPPVLCSLRYMQVSLCPFQSTMCHYRLYLLFIRRRHRRTLRAVVSVVSCRRISLPCRDAACSFTCVCVSVWLTSGLFQLRLLCHFHCEHQILDSRHRS